MGAGGGGGGDQGATLLSQPLMRTNLCHSKQDWHDAMNPVSSFLVPWGFFPVELTLETMPPHVHPGSHCGGDGEEKSYIQLCLGKKLRSQVSVGMPWPWTSYGSPLTPSRGPQLWNTQPLVLLSSDSLPGRTAYSEHV